MLSGVVLKEHGFVLEAERGLPEDQKTVFYLVPKTVRSANETAAAYAGVTSVDRKTQATRVNVPKMNAVDDKEWLRAVKCVKNFLMPENAPQEGYEYFANRLNTEESGVLEKTDDGIVVHEAKEEIALKHIYWAMSPDHVEEVMKAYYDYSVLKEGLKKD